jgi:hypothetical protein
LLVIITKWRWNNSRDVLINMGGGTITCKVDAMEDAALGAGPVVVFRAANGGGVDAADHVDVVAGGVG